MINLHGSFLMILSSGSNILFTFDGPYKDDIIHRILSRNDMLPQMIQ